MTRRTTARASLLAVLLALATCGDDGATSATDALAPDTADAAADATDTSAGADTSRPDTGQPDTGPADTGQPDVPEVNVAPVIDAPGDREVAEGDALEVVVAVSDVNLDDVRVFAEGLPPGARWDEANRTLTFTPDFTQGGEAWTVTLTATDGAATVAASFDVRALDTITPPAPTLDRTEEVGSTRTLVVEQTTDAFLDSPGLAGRTFSARVGLPKATAPSGGWPVRVTLHGFGGGPESAFVDAEIVIQPHDPSNTYWWGYADGLPGSVGGTAPGYTARRVLHLLDWVLETQPADPERVYIQGGSMGGAGAATIGLLHARHFCYVEATIGQKIPRNHRPTRVDQLSGLWGSPAANLPVASGALSVWDHLDLTRALAELPEARDQFVFTFHGKDDPVIHFGAAVLPSDYTGRSWYQALQHERVGHYAVWDEGGHGTLDPVLGAFWSDWGWHRVKHDATFLRRDLPFPAFTSSAADDDPGDGTGSGSRPWSDESGYAADVGTPGDCGWSGDLAGALNRFLRWDASATSETLGQLVMPLRVEDGDGEAPPAAGYPTKGNRYDGPLPLHVDVTIRRAQRFRCLPGEVIRWTFGADTGTVEADTEGLITLPQLPLTTDWTTLVLERG